MYFLNPLFISCFNFYFLFIMWDFWTLWMFEYFFYMIASIRLLSPIQCSLKFWGGYDLNRPLRTTTPPPRYTPPSTPLPFECVGFCAYIWRAQIGSGYRFCRRARMAVLRHRMIFAVHVLSAIIICCCLPRCHFIAKPGWKKKGNACFLYAFYMYMENKYLQ